MNEICWRICTHVNCKSLIVTFNEMQGTLLSCLQMRLVRQAEIGCNGPVVRWQTWNYDKKIVRELQYYLLTVEFAGYVPKIQILHEQVDLKKSNVFSFHIFQYLPWYFDRTNCFNLPTEFQDLSKNWRFLPLTSKSTYIHLDEEKLGRGGRTSLYSHAEVFLLLLFWCR